MDRKEQVKIRFLTIVHNLKLPLPEFEHEFCADRKYRFDYIWRDQKLAIECEGMVHDPKGHHVNLAGYLKDVHKYNMAAILGWRLIRVTPQMIDSGEVVPILQKALKNTGELELR